MTYTELQLLIRVSFLLLNIRVIPINTAIKVVETMAKFLEKKPND